MTAGCRTALLSALLPCVLFSGCRHNNNELIENELRQKDQLYRESLHDLKRLEAQNDAMSREIASIRQGTGPVLPPEIAGPTFGLKRITLGRGTGGYDNDNVPGDEALQVVLEPRDGEEHVVKVPGSLHVSTIEINPQGLKRPLCWWTFTPEQLRPLWKQGLLSTGYVLVLPWTAFPHTETVRVVAEFKLLDGRTFEADKDVKVRLLSPPLHPPDPAFPVGPMPTPTGGPHVPPGPPGPPANPFVMPSGGVQETSGLQWSPSPLTDAVEVSRPRPLLPGDE
jgi:hypothetical protein